MTALLACRRLRLFFALSQAFVLFQCFGLTAGESEEINPCILEMQKIAASVDPKYQVDDKTVHYPTVTIGQRLPGLHGGNRYRINRFRDQWFSIHSNLPNAAQGDVRWFFSSGGEDVAHFFGFELESPSAIIVPDAKDFTGTIEKLNTVMSAEDPIAVRYYTSDPKQPQVPLREYLERFAQKGELPIGPGELMPHDISFHTTAIFYPADALLYARKLTQTALEFTDNFKQAARGVLSEKTIATITDSILRNQGISIDVGSGTLGFVFTGKNMTFNQTYQRSFQTLISNGASPRDYINRALDHALLQVRKEGIELTPFEVADMRGILQKFHREMTVKDIDYAKDFAHDLDQFCSGVRAKRKAIEGAVRKLSPAQP